MGTIRRRDLVRRPSSGAPLESSRRYAGLALLAALALTACTATERHRDLGTTEVLAEDLGIQIQNNHWLAHPAFLDPDIIAAAAIDEHGDVVSTRSIDPRDDDSQYPWFELIVRVKGTTATLAGTKPIEVCWKYIFEWRFLRGDPKPVDCPPPPESPITAPVTVPLPVGISDRLIVALEELPKSGLSEQEVRDRLEVLLPDLEGLIVEVDVSTGLIGVTITDANADDCVMGRTTDPVEVWYPQSRDALNPGIGCSALSAANGEYKDPPH